MATMILKKKPYFIGVDEDGNDMTSGQILEFSTPCPPNATNNSIILNIIIYCSIFTTIALAYYGLSKLSLINSVKWIILYCVVGAIVELLSRFLSC